MAMAACAASPSISSACPRWKGASAAGLLMFSTPNGRPLPRIGTQMNDLLR